MSKSPQRSVDRGYELSAVLAPRLIEIFPSHPLTLNRIVEMEAFAQTHALA